MRTPSFRPTLTLLEDRSTPAALPAGFAETPLATGLAEPTAMAIAPDGRIFFCEQDGGLRVVKNDALLPTPFVSLTVDSAGERGLLGIAFDPNFASNGFVYVYYTTPQGGAHNRVSRFTAAGDVAQAGSEVVLLELPLLSLATNHNGGALRFGPDGKLYVAVGENANAPLAQSLASPLGKILRINSDGSIPDDNPFFNQTTGINRAIWALGLRNPFTFDIEEGTGRIFINDVGAQTFEEINLGSAGANYGWPATEGPTTNPNFVSPLFSYDHSQGIAVTGGAFYNPAGASFPNSFVGKYFYADLGGGYIRLLDPQTRTDSAFATGLTFPVGLETDPLGNLYYLERGTGETTGSLVRVQFTQARRPSPTSPTASPWWRARR